MSAFKATVLVTGGTTGLGFEAALKIAQRRPEYQVVIASRRNTDDASEKMNTRTGHNNVRFLALDLETTSAVRDFASRYTAKSFPPIKALFLNAGLQFPGEINMTRENYEATFAINHIGHALLYHLLQPSLAPDARTVITASGTHDPAQKAGLGDAKYTTAADIAHPSPEARKNWDGRLRYATTKLCNVLWMYALARRLDADNKANGTSMTAVAMDPGLMPGTGLARTYPPFLRFLWNSLMPRILPLLRLLISENIHTPSESGEALARLGVGEEFKGITGEYFEGTKIIKSSADSYVVEKQEDLWDWSVKTLSADGTEAGIRQEE